MSNEDILRMRLVITETKAKLALCRTVVCDSSVCKEIFLLKTKISKTKKMYGKKFKLFSQLARVYHVFTQVARHLQKIPTPEFDPLNPSSAELGSVKWQVYCNSICRR
jgi:hypothetical protein